MKKICPIMSGSIMPDGSNITRIPCFEIECRMWITVYTTENRQVSGCSYEFQPRMFEGLLRV